MPGTSTELADLARTQVPVPTAVALFPHDITFAPKSWCERSYMLRRYTAFESVSSATLWLLVAWPSQPRKLHRRGLELYLESASKALWTGWALCVAGGAPGIRG